MEYHIVSSQIVNLLKHNDMWFESFEHEPVKKSEEAAMVRPGYSLHQGAKAIIVRVKINSANKRFVMLVIPGDYRFDTNKVKTIYGAKDVRFATEQEVAQITNGIKPGGVPPFGNLFGLEVIVDNNLLLNEKIVFNAGDRRFSLAMLSRDYTKLVNPKVTSIS